MLNIKLYNDYASQYFYLLGKNQKKYVWLLSLFIIASFFDMLGIGLIAPFIQLATQPETVNKLGILKQLQNKFSTYDHFVIFIGIVIALVFYLKSIVSYYVQKMIMTFSFNNKAYLINRLMQTYQNLDYSFHVKRNSASLIQHLLENTNIYTEMTLISSLRFISEGVVIVGIFCLLAYSSFIVTTSMALLLLALILIYDKLVKKQFHHYGKELLVSSEAILKWFNQAIYGFKEIRVLGAEKFFYEKVDTNGKMFANAASYAQALQGVPRYLAECALMTIVVGMVVVTLASGNTLTNLIPILGMFAIASFRLIPSVNKAATSFTNIRYSRQAMQNLYDDLSLIDGSLVQSEVNPSAFAYSKDKKFKQICFENVSFRYPEADKEILSHINLTIHAGDCIGLVGKSGAGKTTLIDILLGLYQPTSGSIKIDGKGMDANESGWRKMTAYIPQNFFLLDDSLLCNITLQSDEKLIDKEKLKKVIKETSLEEVIQSLPQGIDTIIGEHGVKLSGGQRQRIALARAFYHDRELIIMDEATSALDSDTEAQIVETIVKMKGLKTLIVIAHGSSTLQACDKIYEVNNGSLIQLSI